MSKMQEAMGKRDGDYIKLHNQWAKVVISREHKGEKLNEGIDWIVSGDLKDPRANEKYCKTLAEATAYALESLAEYERGAYR